nr:MAG TPA: hypothetical protein [Bacteriophage sp.]
MRHEDSQENVDNEEMGRRVMGCDHCIKRGSCLRRFLHG